MKKLPCFVLADGILLLVLLLVGTGCSKKQPAGKTLARVGDEVLTEEMVKKEIAEGKINQFQQQDYITHWVETEVLYDEAKRQGLDNTEEIKRAVEEMKKRMAINALIQKDIIDKTQENLPDSTLRSYYNAHAPEFILNEDVARLNFVLFKDPNKALSFRAMVLKGEPWGSVYQKFIRDSVNASAVIASVDGHYFKQSTLYPAELWRMVTAMSPGEVSVPVSTQFGYYVIMLNSFQRAGQQASFEYVKEDVQARILLEKRQQMFNQMLESLKKKYNAQTFPARDTTKSGKE